MNGVRVGEPFRPYKRFKSALVPEALCRYEGLSQGAKLCWGRLARYQGGEGDAYPSMSTLGEELAVSERQARLYSAELEHQGFLKREPKVGTTNRFVFLWHPIFDEPRKNIAAPLRKHPTAPPRNDSSALGGKVLPPKRVIEESRRQENHFEESQTAQEREKQENGDDDALKPVYASDREELIALISVEQHSGETFMNRERALKIIVALVGLLFVALAYPLVIFVRQEPALSMMFSVYVTLGIFLLLAVRDPSASRSLIAFTAWSSLAHAAVMGVQAFRNMISHAELVGVAILTVIGIALIALAPAKQTARAGFSGRGPSKLPAASRTQI